MNRISKLLTARDIALDVPVSSKKRLLEHAALLFENEHRLERHRVFDSLFARERLGSTGLGHSVAIPHGRIKGLKSPLLAVLRSESGVPFESPDGLPVKLLVVLLVPEHATEEHLEILSELAEILSDSSLRQTLLEAADPEAIHKVLSDWQPYRPAAA
ncbi:MAG: PTS sugar transporter subunit IIA [Burkholderiaceae bacterium]